MNPLVVVLRGLLIFFVRRCDKKWHCDNPGLYRQIVRLRQSDRFVSKIPQEAFIRAPLRVMAIIHLCLAFSLLFWILGSPFMKEAFLSKKQSSLYESVIDNEVSLQKRTLISQKNKDLQTLLTKQSFKIHPFEMTWIALSIAISIMLLKKNPNASVAIWLLPLVTGFYVTENLYFGIENKASRESLLFPSEEAILFEPLSTNILDQKRQLEDGWHRYLVKNWANEDPGKENLHFQKKLEKGKQAFNIARFNAFVEDRLDSLNSSNTIRQPSLMLFAYFLWNLLFAIAANSMKYTDAQVTISATKLGVR